MFAVRPSKSPVQSVHVPLCGYELATDENWYSHLISNVLNGIKKFPIGHRECRIAPSTPLAHMRIKRLLFFLEFVINDGACFIYEGNPYPGRCSKNSLLDREYATLNDKHKKVVIDDCIDSRRDRALTYSESNELQRKLEHDRMLYNGCDRQHVNLSADQIDEFDFLSIHGVEEPPNWKLSCDPNGSVMVGGLRSPCMNVCYHRDCKDRLGGSLTSYDGVFEFEREKEFFYLECAARSIREDGPPECHDLIKDCRISRNLSLLRFTLREHGKSNFMPRSTVCVDEDYWYMRGNNRVNFNDDAVGWPTGSIFHSRDPNSKTLNPTLSQTVRGVTDEAIAEKIKEVLFRNCRDARREFFELRKICHLPQDGCCECTYKECKHYDDVAYISAQTRAYYRAVCPRCVLQVGEPCRRFWKCCIVSMKIRRSFKSLSEVRRFATDCFHFKYERAYIELCQEGNVYENARRHAMRYFSSIDTPESFTSQRLKQLTLSDKMVDKLIPYDSVSLLNPVCRPSGNGAKCAHCEMQDPENLGAYYVPLRPRTNTDNHWKQLGLRLNVCPINNMATRFIDLTKFQDLIELQKSRRKKFGRCGVNCNLRHNLHSTLGMISLNLKTSVDDTVHWPRQNYDKDHESNVRGVRCGCGKRWSKDMKLHSLRSCAWMSKSGDVIYGAYDEASNRGLNVTKSYCDLAIKNTCRCIPSWSLLKHSQSSRTSTLAFNHHDEQWCPISVGSCKTYCGSCVHYCGIQHGS